MSNFSFSFQNANQLPKDAILVKSFNNSSYYVFRIGSEILAVNSETFELFFCKQYLIGELKSDELLSVSMSECIDEYCYYYYAKRSNSLNNYSIPLWFDEISKTSNQEIFHQTSSTRYYLIYLDRYYVHAIDLQTGYHYNCKDYVDIAENNPDYISTPFHCDMRECYEVGVKVYQIPDVTDSRKFKEWMNQQAEAWMGNKYGTTEDGWNIPDSAIEITCSSGRRYAIYDSVEIGLATDLKTRETHCFEDIYDQEWKKDHPEILQDMIECLPTIRRFGYDYPIPD